MKKDLEEMFLEVGLFITQKGKVKYCDAEFAKMVGHDGPESLVDRDIKDLIDDASRDKIENLIISDRIRDGESFLCRFRKRGGDSVEAVVRFGETKYGKESALLAVVIETCVLKGFIKGHEQEKEFIDSLAIVFDSIGDYIFMLDYEGRILKINRSLRKRLGYSEGELVGMDISQIHSFDKDLRPGSIVKGILSGRTDYYQSNFLTKQGVSVPVRTRLTVGYCGGRRVIFGVSHDMTEHKRIENELVKSESFYRHLVENAACVPYRLIFGHEIGGGRYEYIGRNIEDLIGYSSEEFTEKLFHDLVEEVIPLTPTIPKNIISCREAYIRGDLQEYKVDLRIRTKDGEERWLTDSSLPIRDRDSGEIIGSEGILQDITDRKRVEEALRTSEEKYRSMVELAPDGIVTLDRNGIIQSCNSAALRMLDVSRDRVIGNHFTEIYVFSDKDTRRYKRLFESVLKGRGNGKPLQIEFKPKGKPIKWLEVRAAILKQRGKLIGMQAIIRDITERERMDRALRERVTRMELIAHVARSTTAILNPDELLHRAAELIRDAFDYYNVVIRIVENKALVLKAATLPEMRLVEGEVVLKIDDSSISGWVAKEGVPLLVQDVRKDDRYFAALKDMKTKSEVAVPIKLKGKVIGVLDVQSSKLNYFSQDDVITLQTIADQLAIAIENARLYEAAQKQINERTKAQNALKESEERYRHLYENISVGIFRLNPDGEFMIANPSLIKMLGCDSFEEMVEKSLKIDNFMSQEDLEHLKGLVDEKGEIKGIEFSLTRRDGKIIDVLLSVKAHYDNLGTLLYYEGTIEDITDLKKADRQIEERKMYLEAVLAAAPDAIVTVDKDNRIVDWNLGAERLFGYSKDEVIGRNPDELITNRETIKEAAEISKSIMNGKRLFPIKTVRYRKDGTAVEVLVAGSPIMIGGEFFGAVGVYTDISELKRAEKEKEKIQSQLLQAQKMEAIGVLAGGVAHDFNNMMTAIRGSTEMVMCQMERDDPLQSELREVLNAAKHASDLTKQLLLFSRKHPMEFIPLNLNKCIEDLLRMLYRLIGEDVEILTNLGSKLWTIWADRSMIDQIIMNIAVNAKDAMPRGGKLVIGTKNVIIDDDYIKRNSQGYPGRFVCLTIEDTGVGIDSDTLQHIFEPFFSTKGPGRGTGLGLSVVYGIVQRHEGWIGVYSEKGRGTTFNIYFPAVPVKPEQEIEKLISLEEFKGNGEGVLVVEDEKNVREFARRALERNGYRVYTALNAWKALDIFEREKHKLDIVFSDVVLPDKTGVELVEELCKRKPELKVVLTSGYTDHRSQWPAIQERGYTFLQKPYTLNDLLHKINNELVSKR